MFVINIARRVRARWLFSCLLVFSVALLNGRGRAQDTGQDGPLIEPGGFAEASAVNLRTEEQMRQAEALAPLAKETSTVPFMPTIDPELYRAAKSRASVLGPVQAQSTIQPAPLTPLPILGSFEGVTQTLAGGVNPPDTHGAVGHTQFVEVVNQRVVVYNKTGNQLKSTGLGAFFGTSELIFDPRVVYDRELRRWIVVATRASTSSTDTVRRFFLAASKTSDATGAYFIYPVSFGGGPFNNGDWWDFPQLGIDHNAVLVTGNIFDTPEGGFKFAALMPIAKARIYNGLAFNVAIFTGLVGTLAPPIVRDQNSASFFIAAPSHSTEEAPSNSSALIKYTLRYSGSIPALSGPVNIPVAPYSIPPSARQFGTTALLDTSDGRFENASTQIGNDLWQAHTIAFDGTGHPSPISYQINTATNQVTRSQFFSASLTSDDWNASIAANDSDLAVATWSSTDPAAGINAQIRVNSGATLTLPAPLFSGSALFTSPTFYQPVADSNFVRWGDYSAVTIDPVDQNHAWIVNEKINSQSVWDSGFGQVTFPPTAPPSP